MEKMIEVEDIMCDQRIIQYEDRVSYTIVYRRISLAVSILSRAVLPTVINLYYSFLRNQQVLVDNVCNQVLPSVLAFVVNSISSSLSSVQKGITYPIKGKKIDQTSPEKSVQVVILTQPEGDIKVDVIFIHGLHGGLDRTWTQGTWRHENHKLKDQLPTGSNGEMHVPSRKTSLKRTISELYTNRSSPKKSQKKNFDTCAGNEWEIVECGDVGEEFSNCWPRDWIHQDCPGVRVIALNYNTDMLWCPIWQKQRLRTSMIERSDEMIEELIKVGVGERPIVWAGHSKGGLYIKQIIVNTVDRNFTKDINIENIKLQTKAIMFYSVPHKGSLLADISLPLMRRSIELIEVQRNGDQITTLNRRFLELRNLGQISAEIFSFIETSFTLMSFLFLKIVPYDSADLGIGTRCAVPLDHREICKPAGRDCFLYNELIKLIRKAIDD